MPDALTAAVLARIATYRDEITDFTSRLVAIASENPPGRDYPACV